MSNIDLLSKYYAFGICVLLLTGSCTAPGNVGEGSDDRSNGSSSQERGETLDRHDDSVIPNPVSLRHNENGTIRSVSGANLSQVIEAERKYIDLAETESYERQALYFLAKYRRQFLLEDPVSEFVVQDIQSDDLGYRQVKLAQRVDSLPVRHAQVIVQFSPKGHIDLVHGAYAPTPFAFSTTPTITVAETQSSLSASYGFEAAIRYQGSAVLLQPNGQLYLVHEFLLVSSNTEKKTVMVDAHTGEVVAEIDVVVTK